MSINKLTYEQYQSSRKDAPEHRQKDVFRGDLLLSEVAEDGNAESLKYVEDVEEARYDLGEVTDDVLPADGRGPETVNRVCQRHDTQ